MFRLNLGVQAHWHILFEDFNTSVSEFYQDLREALTRWEIPDASIESVEMFEGSVLSARREYLRVSRGPHSFDVCAAPFGTGFFVSWWFVRHRRPGFYVWLGALAFLVGIEILLAFQYLVCKFTVFMVGGKACFPYLFGMFFVLLLLGLLGAAVEPNGLEDDVLALPVIGALYNFLYNPRSYYKQDNAIMFRDAVASAVNEAVNELRAQKGIQALSAAESRPQFSTLRN